VKLAMGPLLPRFVQVDGERKYHGNPCKLCGNTLRYRSNDSCVECRKREIKHRKPA
jgi:hypothetical protein